MRVTNSMISNSAQTHIGNAKSSLLKYEEQFTSEKKIQRPSDDPTVAVRSLKYRSTISQIKQYVEKNVEDGLSWMDTTESAMKNINSILVNMKGYLDQGANDYLAQDERNSVLSVLKQYVSSVFEDEANADYSGRYVFIVRTHHFCLMNPRRIWHMTSRRTSSTQISERSMLLPVRWSTRKEQMRRIMQTRWLPLRRNPSIKFSLHIRIVPQPPMLLSRMAKMQQRIM